VKKNSLLKRLALMLALLVITSIPALAVTPDASDIVATASTTFDTVGALIVTVVGFFVVVKIVKWVRK